MGVQRFRSAEEMNATAPVSARDGGFERFIRHCARYWRLAPRVYPRGVVRFRSIEEAQRARVQVARENARRSRGQGAEPE
ncbi:MAG: hypothetical protein AB2L07_18345 [Thermoanaerobaculaceae bacterium]